MSNETTPGLRERTTRALAAEHYRRTRQGILASPEIHSAALADAVLAVFQPELDRLTERIPYREGETEEQYMERQIARWRSEAWQARGKLREAEAERDQLKAANDRVRALHTRCEGHTRDCDECLGHNNVCSWCVDPYPCPTIAALDQPAVSKET